MATPVHAFTCKSSGTLPQLRSSVAVQSAFNKTQSMTSTHQITAVWDTGAMTSCISERVASSLGLQPVGKVTVHGVDGPSIQQRYIVDLLLPNHVCFSNVTVNSGRFPDFDVLIGMDVITTGDFSISNYNGQTVFTFRCPSQAECDFVKQQKLKDAIGPAHGPGKRKRKR